MAVTTESFKTYFARDFSYGDTVASVMDSDVERAITEASGVFNPGLFSYDAVAADTALLYLTAHMLSENSQMAVNGAGGSTRFPTMHKSVGSVMESFAIPKWVLESPTLGLYATTRYGQKYLSMILPLLVGNAVVFAGATTP